MVPLAAMMDESRDPILSMHIQDNTLRSKHLEYDPNPKSNCNQFIV